jgi:hypothetical protein
MAIPQMGFFIAASCKMMMSLPLFQTTMLPLPLTSPRSTTSYRPSHEPHGPASVNQGVAISV